MPQQSIFEAVKIKIMSPAVNPSLSRSCPKDWRKIRKISRKGKTTTPKEKTTKEKTNQKMKDGDGDDEDSRK